MHQLIETEYPTLKSIGRGDFAQIFKYDEKREDNIRQGKIRRLEKRLVDHRGFRWILEALAGGDLSELDSEIFKYVVQEHDPLTVHNTGTIIKEGLRYQQGRPAIVGHNMFMDLVYLRQCFYGDLPENVEDFACSLHQKFPLVIDTKYIFTHDCGDMNPVASLDVIAEACKDIVRATMSKSVSHAGVL